jgi:glutaredoxin
MTRTIRTLFLLAPVLALMAVLPAQAQYKVVGPDGRVTYTDTPPPQSSGSKVTRLGEHASVAAAAALPLELRQPVQRYPVTLYTMKLCDPCDTARTFLRQRGVPYNEKLIISIEDANALQQLSGAREAPTLTIGAQVLKGLSTDTWGSYLDSAGYPRESKLPANYQYPAATPLVEPPTVAERKPAAAQQPQQPQAPVEQPSNTGIKF